MSTIKLLPFTLLLVVLAAFANAEDTVLDDQVEALDTKAVNLEKDINALEKDMLFPPLTRVEVYLSVAPELRFDLKTLVLIIDNDEKTFHVYDQDDLAALRLGGLQPVWEGNVALGEHQVEVLFKGKDYAGKQLSSNAAQSFKKTRTGHALEIQIKQGKNDKTPEFAIKHLGGK